MTTPEKIDEWAKEQFPEYTPEEKAILAERYTPAQIAALEAGEASINPHDLTIQGRLRTDPYKLEYIEDFDTIQPIIDRRPKTKPKPDPNTKFMTEDEFTEDLLEWARDFFPEHSKTSKTLKDFVWDEYKNVPEEEWPKQAKKKAEAAYKDYIDHANAEISLENMGPRDTEVMDYLLNRSTLAGKGHRGTGNSALAPALPRPTPGVEGLYKVVADPADEGLDDEGNYQDIKKKMNMKIQEINAIRVKQVVSRYVSNQTRLGKVRRTQVIFAAGNGDGWLGVGSAKSVDAPTASLKAKLLAIRNMRPIARYENRTTFGDVESKVSGTVVRLMSRPPGEFYNAPLSHISWDVLGGN